MVSLFNFFKLLISTSIVIIKLYFKKLNKWSFHFLKKSTCFLINRKVYLYGPVNPFIVVMSLQKDAKMAEASELLQLVNTFVSECFENQMSFSAIQQLALNRYDWILTPKSLCQIADIIIKSAAQTNINIAENLVTNFTTLNDLIDFTFRLPIVIAKKVYEASPDITDVLHKGNIANLPYTLPVKHPDISEVPTVLQSITDFCTEHAFAILVITGLCVGTYFYYKHFYTVNITKDLKVEEAEDPTVLSSIYESDYLYDHIYVLLLFIFLVYLVQIKKTKLLMNLSLLKKHFKNIYKKLIIKCIFYVNVMNIYLLSFLTLKIKRFQPLLYRIKCIYAPKLGSYYYNLIDRKKSTVLKRQRKKIKINKGCSKIL